MSLMFEQEDSCIVHFWLWKTAYLDFNGKNIKQLATAIAEEKLSIL